MPSCKDTAILREDKEKRDSGLLHDVLWDHESDGKVAAAPREVRHGDIRIFDERVPTPASFAGWFDD